MGSSTYPVFSRCNALTTLNIGSEVQMIPAFAFSYCIGLTEITIPESVTGIGNSAFAYCIGLTKVTNLNPAPQAINAGVFESVAMGDASLYVPAESVKAYKAADVWKDFRTVTAIGAESGTCGANLTWMLLNRTLTISGTGAMSDYYASNAPWYVYRDSIETAVIEDGVTSIGSYAFSWCSSLASVTIGESVTHIGNFAFRYCMSLTAIDVHEYNAVYASENGVLFNKAKTTLILYPEGKPEVSYTISNGVASIESAAFISCSSLASVTIPESVTGIGEYPFIYCNSLTAINVSTNNAVYASENGVLFNKAKTSLLQYPAGKPEINYTIPNGVTGIGMRAFDSCHNLSSVMIGESVTNIGDHAFYNCSSLTSVTISESVTNIGEYAFGWCSSLASVEIPNNVEIIGNSAFISCRSLASVTIGESVTNIGYNAFAWCSSLASVTIGESVTSIGELAFYDCYNLTSVTNLSPTPQVINSNVFENISIGKITTLYVPAESVEAYKAADVWKDFKMITEYVPSAINAPTSANAIRVYPNPATESFRIAGLTTPTPVTVTNVNGQTVLQQTVTSDESISVGHLPQGVYFVRVNGKTVKVIKSF
jgi:hypothetical protein